MTSLPAQDGFEQIDDEVCRGFQRHLEVVGRRWNSAILLAGARGATRFTEYRAMIAGISDRLLTQRLTELQAEGLVERTVLPTTPVLVQYRLTPMGRDLMRLLQPLVAFDRQHRLHSVSD
ncbi:winged helix-turn-helix transcriptional regulator [Lysinimonas soli]|uniref:Winged helix-turn-helix transcriptional regulator n=1 Tax=Lysinimonas soli TaxID=1074233 RepID=A0ABW0NMW1_9MICO